MIVIKYSLTLILLNFLTKCRGLEKITTEEDTTIKATESIIRKTVNKIFATLHIRGVKTNQKIRQLTLAHNFMVGVTMRDNDAHNTIVKLSRINKMADNVTQNLVNLINDILNEDSRQNDPAITNEVLQYVDGFLDKLQGFKENSDGKDVEDKLGINQDVLKILDSKIRGNITAYDTAADEEEILNDNDFWVPEHETRRIYKGYKTKVKYFPFMASIQMFNSFQCGGSIITSDLVITAASCLQLAWNNRFYRENPAFLSVRVGSNFYKGGGENIPVIEVYFHPDYDPKNLRNNICLLRLLRRLRFRKKRKAKVKKIAIDSNASPLPMTADGVTIVGWGATSASNIIKSPYINRLSYSVLDVYHLQECQEIYSREYVSKTNFCAGFISKGGGACNHDVGGPGIVNGILTGVVSFGSPVCGTPDAPTVFTKVGYYYDWIEEIMEMEVPHTKKRTTLKTTHFRQIFTKAPPHVPTTFKMEPMMEDWQPTGNFDEPGTLRLLDDESLFKQFLKTMFTSQEAKEYTDLINNVAVNKAKDVEASEEINFKQGKNFITNLDSDTVTPKIIDFVTKLDSNLYYESVTKRKPVKAFLDTKTNETDVAVPFLNDLNMLNKPVNYNKNIKLKKRKKTAKNADDVFTLLYISKEDTPEKIGSIIEDFDENISDGLTIPLEEFRDLTFRNNKTSEVDYLSKSELYDLLNEVIQENDNIM